MCFVNETSKLCSSSAHVRQTTFFEQGCNPQGGKRGTLPCSPGRPFGQRPKPQKGHVGPTTWFQQGYGKAYINLCKSKAFLNIFKLSRTYLVSTRLYVCVTIIEPKVRQMAAAWTTHPWTRADQLASRRLGPWPKGERAKSETKGLEGLNSSPFNKKRCKRRVCVCVCESDKTSHLRSLGPE